MSLEYARRIKSTLTLLVSGFLGTPLALQLLEVASKIVQGDQFRVWVEGLGVSAAATILVSTIVYQILGYFLNLLAERRMKDRLATNTPAMTAEKGDSPVFI